MIVVNKDILQDISNIANGVYNPLRGFLGEKDYKSVLDNMRLASGEIWSIPIVLDISEEDVARIKDQGSRRIVLTDDKGVEIAILEDLDIYKYDKEEFAQKVYRTTDIKHPGVASVMAMKDYLAGGRIVDLKRDNRAKHTHNPAEIKDNINKKGWKTVVAFQTRNVPHRGHEFLQVKALEKVDGLLIHPVIGDKKVSDFKDEYILSVYQMLIDKGYYKDKALLSALPIKMKYAGPREALLHALIRRNYGCTHFVVGRDHAGVGDYYRPTEAQEIFDEFDKDELGIEIMKFDEVVYDSRNKKHCFVDECAENDKISFSGTKLRKFIEEKIEPPEYLIRPEVYNFLINSSNSLVDDMYKKNNNKQGFVLWFTGLSAAGKTTIADRVCELLDQNGTNLERLDGDVVRENLTKDLGFSKEDRDENIRRIGFVADLLSRNNVGVIASFISPYKKQRDELREKVNNYIEIFVDTPLEICEQRDPKGMYKKARAGEIKMFTGISDPYEAPENPEIHLKSHDREAEVCAQEVIEYLKVHNII